MPGARPLSSLRGKLDRVKLACTRCDRQEVVRIEDLAERYGWDAPLPDVRRYLARDCPNRTADLYRRCDPVFRRA